ncbi:MAG: zf-HC2 domain-containing protein [Candidatus Omnitrophica bacterium]|nr:zf-HC2 domain-containing protein [Candidatus Omnitrophota bacterium]
MKCEKYLELISLYIDRDLEQDLIDVLEEHLSLCRDCMVFFHTMEKTVALSRTYYKKKCCRVPKAVSTKIFYNLRLIYKKEKF